MNVLSLFDGISCGRVALERAGIKVDNYYASEIDEKSIMISKKNYPDIIQLGDICDIKYENNSIITSKLVIETDIDLVIGGSPCQDLSLCKPTGQGLKGQQSQLFWEYIIILNEVKPKYFLLENVKMKQEWQDIITAELQVEPIEINSALVSAQNRRRLYWTNIPNVEQPQDKGILIKDILYDNNYKIFTDERITNTKKLTKNYVKWDMSGKQYWSQQDRAYFLDGKMCTVMKGNASGKLNICLNYEQDIYRRCHPVEAERLQTLDDHYTEVQGITNNQRIGIIGNGWTVDVISHIFKNIL